MRRPSGWLTALAALLALTMPVAPAGAEPSVIPPLIPLAQPSPIQTRFRDWTITCAPGCRAFTALRSQAPGAPEVLRLALAPTAQGGDPPALTLRTPLPLYLPDPAQLTLGDLPPVPIPWFTCAPAGCEARLTPGPDLLAALRAERAAEVELTLVGGDHARLRLSLLGLTAALEAAAGVESRAAKPLTP